MFLKHLRAKISAGHPEKQSILLAIPRAATILILVGLKVKEYPDRSLIKAADIFGDVGEFTTAEAPPAITRQQPPPFAQPSIIESSPRLSGLSVRALGLGACTLFNQTRTCWALGRAAETPQGQLPGPFSVQRKRNHEQKTSPFTDMKRSKIGIHPEHCGGGRVKPHEGKAACHAARARCASRGSDASTRIALFPPPVRLTRHPSPSHQDSGSAILLAFSLERSPAGGPYFCGRVNEATRGRKRIG